jgi:hypothetical protein
MTTRVVAVDWSGAVRDAGNIWLAEVVDGAPVRLERMRSREAVAGDLIASARRDPRFVAGLDFAFSFPAWFARGCGATSAVDLWRVVEERGEAWLATCGPPFFGRAGSRRDRCAELYRRTERECQARHGVLPKSVFQIGGAGAVGTGSIRGMPVLRRFHDAGFCIWPFDVPAFPTVIEIYPRLFAPDVTRSRQDGRRAHLDAHHPHLSPTMRAVALASEDAFDALVSALGMWRRRHQLAALPAARDDLERLEGAIWMPNDTPVPDEPVRRQMTTTCPLPSTTFVAPPLHGVERGPGGEV